MISDAVLSEVCDWAQRVSTSPDISGESRLIAQRVLLVLSENEALRELVDRFETVTGPRSVLPTVERLLRVAVTLLEVVRVSDGDSIDHLITMVTHAADRVEYERKAAR